MGLLSPITAFVSGVLLYTVINTLVTLPSLKPSEYANVFRAMRQEPNTVNINQYPEDAFPQAPCMDMLSILDVQYPVRSLNPPPISPLVASSYQHAMDGHNLLPCQRGYDRNTKCASDKWRLVIGIATAVESLEGKRWDQQPFIANFIASLTGTLHHAYAYRIYLTYNIGDLLYADIMARKQVTAAILDAVIDKASTDGFPCGIRYPYVTVHWVLCTECSGMIYKALEMAITAAVLEGAEYILKVPQGVRFPAQNSDWTPTFIDKLLEHTIPNLGVVVATTSNANCVHFLHRTHMAVFGFYLSPTLRSHPFPETWIRAAYRQYFAAYDVTDFAFEVEADVKPYPSLTRTAQAQWESSVVEARSAIDTFAGHFSTSPLRFIPHLLADVYPDRTSVQ